MRKKVREGRRRWGKEMDQEDGQRRTVKMWRRRPQQQDKKSNRGRIAVSVQSSLFLLSKVEILSRVELYFRGHVSRAVAIGK